MIDGKLGVAIHGVGPGGLCPCRQLAEEPARRRSSRSAAAAGRVPRSWSTSFGLDCRVRDDFDEVLRDERVDIVNLSGPNHVHTPQGIAAAEAGKHILMEKPMCLSMEENRALRDAVAKAGVRERGQLRAPLESAVREPQVAAGRRGRSASCSTSRSTTGTAWAAWWTGWEWGRTPRERRQHDAPGRLPRGRRHPLVRRRRRWSRCRPSPTTSTGNFEFDANVVAILKFDDGAIGKTSALFDAEMPYQFNIDLVGTEGTLRDNRVWSKRLLPGPDRLDHDADDPARLGRRATIIRSTPR